MYLRKHPHIAWPIIVTMIWASLSLPVIAQDSTKPASQISNVPTSDDAPIDGSAPSSTTTTDANPQVSNPALDAGENPATDPALTGTPQVQINADQAMLQQLQQQAVTPSTVVPTGDHAGEAVSLANLVQHGLLTGNTIKPSATDTSSHWNVQYTDKSAHMQLGEIGASINGNDFASLNKTVNGVQVDVTMPKGTITGLVSKIKSTVQTDTIPGQNSSGPYYLTMPPIVPNSEAVRLNDQKLTRGFDYTIDYAQGTLQLLRGRLVSSDDTITVTYDVAVDGAGGGQLIALRGTYPINDKLTVGISHIGLKGDRGENSEASVGNTDHSVTGFDVSWNNSGKGLGLNLQTAVSSGGQNSQTSVAGENVVDEPVVLHSGIPANQQQLRLRRAPIQEGSERVRFQTRTLARNRDYTLNYQTGELRLLNPSLSTPVGQSVLYVSYATRPVSTSAKDHSAMSATATYNTDRFTAMARYRKADRGFSPIDQSGANLVDRAVEWASSYSPSDTLTLSTSGDNTQLPTGQSNFEQSSQTLKQQNRSYSIDFHNPKLPSAMLQHTIHESHQLGDTRVGDSSVSDTFSSTWSKGNYTAGVNLDHTVTAVRQQQYGQQATTEGAAQSAGDAIDQFASTVNSASVNLGYHPSDKLGVNVNVSANKSKSTSNGLASTTGGKGVQADATYKPAKNLSLTASLATSKNDAVKSAEGEISPAQRNRNLSLRADWQPAKHVNVGMQYREDRYDGGDYGKQALSTLSSSTEWQAGKDLTFMSYWAHQSQKGMLTSGASSSNMVGIGTRFSPLKNTTVGLDLQRLWGADGEGVNQLYQTEGQTQRATDAVPGIAGTSGLSSKSMTALTGNIGYHLSDKHEIALTGEMLRGDDSASGPTRRNSVGIGWHYHADDNLTFSLDARRVQYADKVSGSSNNANELTAELQWQF